MTAAHPITIVKPIGMTDAKIIATNVPEVDASTWASGTAYALDALVMLNHVIYKSLQGSNVNHNPETSPTWWSKVSATNRWKAFDTSSSSQTSQASSITYQLRPGQPINAVGLLNLTATQVRVRMIDPVDGTVYDKTTNLVLPISDPTWYAYFFEPLRRAQKVLMLDLPTYGSADIYIDVTGTGTVGVGVIVVGFQSVFSAGINYGSRFGGLDYSRITTDAYGISDLERRGWANKANLQIDLDPARVDAFFDYLADVRGIPCLWLCHQPISALSIFGIAKDNDFSTEGPSRTTLSLSINGMT